MLPPGTRLRRATLDDLETLRGLWQEARLPAYDLERRFTEFQLVVDGNDWILAGIGFRAQGTQGHVHSLAIRRTDLEQELSGALWDRVQTLARQAMVFRLWTRDTGRFWAARGFGAPGLSERKEFPAAWGAVTEGWQTFKLRDDPMKVTATEDQLQAYLEMERMKMERLVRRGQFLKILGLAIAGIVFLGAVAVLLLVVRRRPASGR